MKIASALFLFLVVLAFTATESTNAQEVYFSKYSCMNGEAGDGSTAFNYDLYKDNMVFILVKFPSAYGQNRIHFRHKKVGEPGPVAYVDVDPASTWVCYEMNIPQWGEYTITITDADGQLINEQKITIKEPKF